VLLIDDQPLIGEAVRRMLAGESDIDYFYLSDPTKALEKAQEIGPTVILQDLVMPQIEGLDIVKQFRAHVPTREIPMIVLSTKEEATTKEKAFGVGANDYLVKLPDRLELLARIRYHSKGYINLLERNQAYQKLAESQKLLADEVASAAKYVQSLLPEKITQGPLRTDWRFVPATYLAGDTFGYHWLDNDHFACYLLDVTGHGVASALLSVSVLNAIRAQALPGVDFLDPGQVITGMNKRFQMSQHSEKCFTAWYGVINTKEREIRFAGGGHPPALLFSGNSADDAKLEMLSSTGPVVGTFDDFDFATDSAKLGPYSLLYVYSDGVHEIKLANVTRTWPMTDFFKWMEQKPKPGASKMDELMEHTKVLSGEEHWEDDFSIVEIVL
jgi:sigma-B regulation protein RsbU (phosphoserine phosphatase)